MTQAQNLANLSQDYGVIPMSNRNYFIDPALENWMPGISGTQALPQTVGQYTGCVMWSISAGAGGAATLNWMDARTAGIAQLASPGNYFNINQTTASTGSIASRNQPVFFQNIEMSPKLAGKSVTLSFVLWSVSGTIAIPAVVAYQGFGSGGSPSPSVLFDKNVNWNVTTTPKKFSVRVDVPSIAGKTIGTNNNPIVGFGLWLPTGVTFNLNIAECQCEVSNPLSSSDLNGNGGEPTAFEYRGQQAELARVRRYYNWISVSMRYPSSGANQYGSCAVAWQDMRTVPANSVQTVPSVSLAQSYAMSQLTIGNGRFEVQSSGAGDCYAIDARYVLDARL